jgi:hypothetical protein
MHIVYKSCDIVGDSEEDTDEEDVEDVEDEDEDDDDEPLSAST